MLHHISFAVADLLRAARFYDGVLGALGFVRVWSFPDAVGYGEPGGGDRFALKQRGDVVAAPSPGFHLAFTAADRGAVDRFHEAGVRLGGVDHGAPGLRPRYGPDYYAAFLVDPDGYTIEAVTRAR